MNTDLQDTRQWDQLWTNVHIATMSENITKPYGAIKNACIAINQQQIAWIGPEQQLPGIANPNLVILDGQGLWMTPGLIDCHTHLIYGGNRATEYEQRLLGASYEEITKNGGGIHSTIRQTRNADAQLLFNSAQKRLSHLIKEGVTTVEIKSGYGLNFESERKILQVARQLNDANSVDIINTFLGAHIIPEEFKNMGDEYVEYLCHTMMPGLYKEGLIDAIDVYCEHLAFNLSQTEKIFRMATELSLPIHCHAEQFSASGAAQLAANYQALSVDHLEYLQNKHIPDLKKNQTAAVLLPGAFYYLKETRLPPVADLLQQNVPIAIATDANPGTSPAFSLLTMLNMACQLFSLTPEQALTGVTRNAAKALGIEKNTGSIEVGKQADLVLWDIEHPSELSYYLGINPCSTVIKSGTISNYA